MTRRASTDPSLEPLTETPELCALTPLLYVAWADGALGSDQLEQIREVSKRRFGAETCAPLQPWLDPDAPPSSTALMQLYRFVREHVSQLSAEERGDLVDLGGRIAEAVAPEGDVGASALALREIEAILGVKGSETARYYFEVRPPTRQHFEEVVPPFSIAELRRVLDGEHRALWDQVRAMVAEPSFAIEPGLSTQVHRERVRTWLLDLAERGVGRLSFAEDHGGVGDRGGFMKFFEALGIHDLSLVVKMGVQFGLFGGAISNLGTDEQCKAYLPDVASGKLLGGFAMTELGHGSNVRDLETVARYDAGRGVFVLHTPSISARKEWIGNAAVDGRAMVVFAQLEVDDERKGVHAFYVDVRDENGRVAPGCHIEDCGDKMGLAGVDNGRLWFDHVEVPRGQLLGRYGEVDAEGGYHSPIADDARRFFTMLGTLVAGRISVAAAAISASKVALASAVRYGALRRQFGPAGRAEIPIIEHRALQQRLMPQVAATYAFHFAVEDLQQAYQSHPEGGDSRALEARAAGLKALATWHGIESVQAARECCGGMGFLTVNRICQIRRDIDVFATFEGDNTVLLQLMARALLGGFAKRLGDDLLATVVSEIGRRAREALIEQNPVAQRRVDGEHLLDADFHREAFAFRSHNLLVSAARRFKKRTDEGLDPFVAFGEIQDHCVALARAHTEQQVLESFTAACARASDPDVAAALESLRALWGVWRLREDVGWFLENDYVSPKKARAIRKTFGDQCAAVRKHAVALVNAFGVPNEALGPIAFEGYTQHAGLARREPA